tara:strand:- start:26 stop:208 length:183 start_codon:yes stop_codon:yes gene_type:complete
MDSNEKERILEELHKKRVLNEDEEDILLNQFIDLKQLYEKNKEDKVLKRNIELLRKKLES